MINQTINDKGILFMACHNGAEADFQDWKKTDDVIYYLPLATLADNGYAYTSKEGCFVPYENLYLLDEEDRFLLGIPPLYDKAIRLTGNGLLNSSDFEYRMEFLTHVPDGELIPHERKGNILMSGREKWLLSEAQYELAKQVDDFNTTPDDARTVDYNLRQFAGIKILAEQARCELTAI